MKLLVLLLLVYVTAADETPGFFIKLSKSVPRIGRRGDFENFFLKQSKSVPRIGRRGGFLVRLIILLHKSSNCNFDSTVDRTSESLRECQQLVRAVDASFETAG